MLHIGKVNKLCSIPSTGWSFLFEFACSSRVCVGTQGRRYAGGSQSTRLPPVQSHAVSGVRLTGYSTWLFTEEAYSRGVRALYKQARNKLTKEIRVTKLVFHHNAWCAWGCNSNVASHEGITMQHERHNKGGRRENNTPADGSVSFCQTQDNDVLFLQLFLSGFKNAGFDFREGDALMAQRVMPLISQSVACSLLTSHFQITGNPSWVGTNRYCHLMENPEKHGKRPD